MAVYVDPLVETEPMPQWPYRSACHLTADSLAELHAFAAKLGLKRAWFQGQHVNPACWHSDLTTNKRRQAVRLGAVEITHSQRAAHLFAGTRAEKPE
jgi:hypothetical protein